jgi:hypothetical protein
MWNTSLDVHWILKIPTKSANISFRYVAGNT